ncbi:MAG: hypothetical protein ABI723_26425 [Bacteroidia bacterium]
MLSKLTEKIKNALCICPINLKQRKFNLLLFDDIEKVPNRDWKQVVNDDVFWSASYHKALQKGCSANVGFRYVLIYENEQPVAACYLQLIDLKNLSLKAVLNPEYFERIYSKMNGMGNDYAFGKNGNASEYLVICGNLFVSGNYGISSNDDELLGAMKKTFPKIMELIAKGLENDATIFATVLKDFDNKQEQLFDVFQKSGFIPFEIDPDMIIPIDKQWKHFDDYLEAFSSKYRVRANSVIAKGESLTVKNFTADEIKKHAGEISVLFNAVLKNAPVRIACNTSEYFYHLKTNLADRFSFTSFLSGGKLVAFSTAIINSHCTHAHHIGLDYSANKTFALYQNILYHYVSDAIANKSAYVNLGRDALEIKSTVGAVPEHLKLFVRFSNSFTHLILESFSKLTHPREWTQRRPFREVTGQLMSDTSKSVRQL